MQQIGEWYVSQVARRVIDDKTAIDEWLVVKQVIDIDELYRWVIYLSRGCDRWVQQVSVR